MSWEVSIKHCLVLSPRQNLKQIPINSGDNQKKLTSIPAIKISQLNSCKTHLLQLLMSPYTSNLFNNTQYTVYVYGIVKDKKNYNFTITQCHSSDKAGYVKLMKKILTSRKINRDISYKPMQKSLWSLESENPFNAVMRRTKYAKNRKEKKLPREKSYEG